jgi:hypothetical protein
MRDSRGLIVISPNGRFTRHANPVLPPGEGAPSILNIDGQVYDLYRYTLYGITGRVYGFVAAKTPPTSEEREVLALELFGPKPFGILRLERVDGTVEPESM